MTRCLALALLIGGLAVGAFSARAITVAGVVHNVDGAAVEAADVWIIHEQGNVRAKTSADGVFSIEDLTTGEVDLVIYKEGFALGGATGPLTADASVEILLTPAAKAIARVVGPDLAPLGGARLRFAVLDDELRVRMEELTELGLPSVRSGADGKMEIPWARSGGFVSLVVSHNRYADATLPYQPVSDEITLTVVLPEGGELRGRILDPNGIGAPHSRVDIFDASTMMEQIFTTISADEEGFYRVRLPIGPYRVRARHPEFAAPPARRANLPFKGSDALANVNLEPPSSISGRIVDESGAGMPGIEVSYWMEDLPHSRTVTSADGEYRLRVPKGEGSVHVESPQGYMRDDPIDAMTRLTTPMDITLDPVELRALPVIKGTVIDVEGEPVADAILQARNLGMPVWQRTDDKGAFEIRLAFEPKNPNVVFEAEHPRRFQRKEFEVAWRDSHAIAPQLARFEPNLMKCDPDSVLNVVDKLRGEPAPEWACTSWIQSPLRDEESGAPRLQLDDLRGKVVVLTFWGGFDNTGSAYIWMQWLNMLHAVFREDEHVAFVAIHDGVSQVSEVAGFVNEYSVEYAVGIDGNHDTFDRYDTNVIPQTFLIDKEGVLRYYDVRGRLLELIKSLRIEGSDGASSAPPPR